MTEEQRAKRRFRNSKKWKEFRHSKHVEQRGIDYITHKKLTKTANLHHMCMRTENYSDLSHPENFVYLNKMSHDMVHFLYRYYKEDSGIIERIVEILERMVEINVDNQTEEIN